MRIVLIAFAIVLIVEHLLGCRDLLDVKRAAEEASDHSKGLFPESGHNLLVQILFSSSIGLEEETKETSRLRWLRCSLRKLQEYSRIQDIVVWAHNKSILSNYLRRHRNVVVLELPTSSWQLPCGLHDNSTWHGRHMFDIDYYIRGRWRLTFPFYFARGLGYRYYMQYDDDAILQHPVLYDIGKRFHEDGIKHAVLGSAKGIEFKYYVSGLPELTKEWIVSNNYSIRGELLNHVNPENEISSLTTSKWDREYYSGYFMAFSLDFWFQDDVQDYLKKVFSSNYDIERRWKEQAVMNMIRLVFLKSSEILVVNDIVVKLTRNPSVFNSICRAGFSINDAAEAVTAPSPRPSGYILIESSHGLANRLRVLASYLYLADHKFFASYIVMVWEINNACVGHFLEVFEPIPNVVFIPKSLRSAFEAGAVKSFWDTYQTFGFILNQNGIHLNANETSETENEIYKKFRPIENIIEDALIYIQNNSICHSNSLHIRRTDFHVLERSLNSDKRFMEVISNSNDTFFLTTDNVETRKMYINKFGPRKILVYGHFSYHLSRSIRKSFLQLAVTEAIIAAHSKEFHLSYDSSWSEYILLLHHKCKLEKCCHALDLAASTTNFL